MNKEWTVYNTRTGAKIKNYQYANEKQVFDSIDQLHKGFKAWKKLPFKTRQEKLLKLVQIVEKDQDHLARVISDEMSKPFNSALAEVKKCIVTSQYLCALDISFLEPQIVQNTTYDHSVVAHEPRGVLLSILPWNFPAWQGFRAFFPNLIAGNTVLIKHSEITPTVGDLLQSYFEQAGLGDILKHQLFSHDLTEKIVASSKIGGVSITGSIKAGKIIAELCSRHLRKYVLELGGSDPSIVLEDCDVVKTCQTIARARLQNAGQVCISAKRAFFPRNRLHEMNEQLVLAFRDILEGSTEVVGPLADARFKADYNKQVSELKKHSQVVFEKNMDSLNQNDQTAFVNPCILLFDQHHELLKTTEVFGPCLAVIPYDTVDEAIDMANDTIFGLGASVYGKDEEHCRRIAREMQAGQVSINDFVKSDICLPFGGFKMSGLGRESGHEGFFEFTQTRVISDVKK